MIYFGFRKNSLKGKIQIWFPKSLSDVDLRNQINCCYQQIKLGLMKWFTKTSSKDKIYSMHFCKKFSSLPEVKLKEYIFIGTDISKLISDAEFVNTQNTTSFDWLWLFMFNGTSTPLWVI